MLKCGECGVRISDAEAKNPLDGRKLCIACFARWSMTHQVPVPAGTAIPDYSVIRLVGGAMRAIGVLAAGMGGAALLADIAMHFLGVNNIPTLVLACIYGVLFGTALAVAGELLLILRDVTRKYLRR